ncbi:hypothetical protein GCM10028806_28600 [Spirosoma terrae]|uniref:Ig-like domain-containing protein n=1 Tax=Spirosoma terrae TaxID=1968276 RepID=A0A6L9LKH2_9BACT|nr:hypothetical protein [Spirosoma terrae]NDU97179.1 hypothetical protein [Spirosoma terrae]
MKRILLLLGLFISVAGFAQKRANPRVEISYGGQSYSVTVGVPARYYAPTPTGKLAFENAVYNGIWTLTTDDGCVIPAGTKPPNFKPTCCDLSVVVNSPTTTCGVAATLTASVSGTSATGVTYKWTGPNSYTASGAAIQVAQSQNGLYSYTVTAKNSGNCSAIAQANVTVSGCNPPPNTYLAFNRAVFVGNSITKHPPAPGIGWLYYWGMAASAEDKDFVHLMLAALRTANPNLQHYITYDGAYFEGNYLAGIPDNLYKAFYTDNVEAAFGAGNLADFIGVYISENLDNGAFNETQFRAQLDKLLASIPHTSNCTIQFRNSFWDGQNLSNAAIQQYCLDKGYKFVDISSIRELSQYMSPDVDGHHPNDAGMAALASLQLEQLKTTSGANCDFAVSVNSPSVSCNTNGVLTATVTGSGSSGVTYSWSGADGLTASTQSIAVQKSNNGTYAYTVSVGKSGCTAKTATGNLIVTGCSSSTYVAKPGYGNLFADNSTYVDKPEFNRPSSSLQFPRAFIIQGNTRVAINTKLGSVIDYMSFNGGLFSTVNSPIWGNGKDDAGRQLMDAAYTNPNGSVNAFGEGPYEEAGQSTAQMHPPGAGSIGNNPVQGGGAGENPLYGDTEVCYADGSLVYYKTRPVQWDLVNIYGQMRMKGWIDIDPTNSKVVRRHARWEMQRVDPYIANYPTPRQQEAPCWYTTTDFKRVFYRSGRPFTNAPLQEYVYDEGGGGQEQIIAPPIIASEPVIYMQSRTNPNLYIAIITNGARFSVGGFNNEYITGNAPTSFKAHYIGATPLMSLDPDGVYDFDAAFVQGTLAEIDNYVYNHVRLRAQWNGRFSYVFNGKSRMGFFLHKAKDQLEKNINTYISVKPLTNTENAGKDFNISTPEKWIDGRVVKHVYVRMAVTSSDGAFWLRWVKPGLATGTEYYKEFNVIADGQFRTYDIDMTGVANWDGSDITSFVLRKRNNNDTHPQEEWKIEFISDTNLTPINP